MTILQEDQHVHEDDGLPAHRLTKAEIKELRELLEAERRAKWAWSTGRIWATWLTGTIVAVYAMYDAAEKLLRKFIS